MITYRAATYPEDITGIYQLQKQNLPGALSAEERVSQGFVTVDHEYDLLQKMNERSSHVVAVHNEGVIGYALTMLKDFRHDIPILIPMFDEIDALIYKGDPLGSSSYFIMGQICVDRLFRGKGVFRGLYEELARQKSGRYRYIITEISTRNARSIRAHEKIGFEKIHAYRSDDGEDWVIVLLII